MTYKKSHEYRASIAPELAEEITGKMTEAESAPDTNLDAMKASARQFQAELLALEPRILLDAAGVATASEFADEIATQQADSWTLDSAVQNEQSSEITDLLLATDSATTVQRSDILYIDAAVENANELISEVGNTMEIIRLEARADGVQQIADSLKNRTDVSAIHIISHGRSGTLDLGNTKLTEASMQGRHSGALEVIRSALSDSADILIYGCDFGAGTRGESAIAALAAATDADVSASSDETGAAILGGDWDLEVAQGAIEAVSLQATEWVGLLATGGGADDDGGGAGIALTGGTTSNVDVLANDTITGTPTITQIIDPSDPANPVSISVGTPIQLTTNTTIELLADGTLDVTSSLLGQGSETFDYIYTDSGVGGQAKVTLNRTQGSLIIVPTSASGTEDNSIPLGITIDPALTSGGSQLDLISTETGYRDSAAGATPTNFTIPPRTTSVRITAFGGMQLSSSADAQEHRQTFSVMVDLADGTYSGQLLYVIAQNQIDNDNYAFSDVALGSASDSGTILGVSGNSVITVSRNGDTLSLVESQSTMNQAYIVEYLTADGTSSDYLGSSGAILDRGTTAVETTATIATDPNANFLVVNIQDGRGTGSAAQEDNGGGRIIIDLDTGLASGVLYSVFGTSEADNAAFAFSGYDITSSAFILDPGGTATAAGGATVVGDTIASTTRLSNYIISMSGSDLVLQRSSDYASAYEELISVQSYERFDIGSSAQDLGSDAVEGVFFHNQTLATWDLDIAGGSETGTILLTATSNIMDSNPTSNHDHGATARIFVDLVNQTTSGSFFLIRATNPDLIVWSDVPFGTRLVDSPNSSANFADLTETTIDLVGALQFDLITNPDGSQTLQASAQSNDTIKNHWHVVMQAQWSGRTPVRLSGYPNGGTFSAGALNPTSGLWEVDAIDIAGISFVPPTHFSGTTTTMIVDYNGDQHNIDLNISRVADTPTLVTANQSGIEDTAIDISAAVSASLVDADGSETLELFLENIPVGHTVSDGTNSFTATAGSQIVDIAAWNIASLTYTGATNFVGTVTLNVRARSTDDDGFSATTDTAEITDSFDIEISNVNDDPSGADNTFSILEDASHTFSAADFGFADPNDIPPNAFLEVIILTLPSPADGVLTLSGTSVTAGQVISVADIPNLVFASASNVNGSGLGAFTFQVRDNGGTANGGVDTDQSPNTIQFNIAAVNDAPVNTVPGAQTVAEDMPLAIAGVSVTDVDGNLATTQLSVSDGTLTVDLSGGATISLGANGSNDLTLSGTEAEINAALATLSYQGNLNFSGSDTLTVFSADSDGTPLTDTDTILITVTPINDAPVNTVPGPQTVDEDTQLSITGISVTDVDGNLATTELSVTNGVLNVTLSGAASISAGANGSATLTISGTQADINATLATLIYQGDLNFNGLDTLTVLSTDSDGTPLSDSDTVAITVTPVNDAPVAVDDGPITVIEDTAATGNLLSNDNDADGDALSIISFAIAGDATSYNAGDTATIAGVGTLQINANGIWTFTPDAGYTGAIPTATYMVSDGNLTDTADLSFNAINNVNDAPTLDLDSDDSTATGADFAGTFTENGTAISIVDGDLTVGDQDDNIIEMTVTLTNGQVGDMLQYPSSLPGGISAMANPGTQLTAAGPLTITFNGNAATTVADWRSVLASINFLPTSSNVENPDTTTRNIEIVLTDDAGATSDTAISTISVIAVNDPPSLDLDDDNSSGAAAGNASISFTENGGAVVLHSGIQLLDPDSADLQSANMTFTNPLVDDQLLIDGVLVFDAGAIQLASGTSNGVAYTVSLSAGSVVVDFSGVQPIASYEAALESISFNNVSENPDVTDRVFEFSANDGAVSTQVRTTTVSVTAVNDAPVNTVPGAQTVAEDMPLAVTGVSVADVDGNLASTQLSVSDGTLTVDLSGGATISLGANGSNDLTLSGTEAQINAALATLSYQGNLNFSGSDTLTVLSTDGDGTPLTDTDTVSITVTAVNDAPVNTVPGAQTVAEDTPLAIAGVSVTDADGNLASTQLSVSDGTLTVDLTGGATISAGANGSNDLTLSGTEAQINAVLATLSYQGNLDFNGSDTLTILSTDSDGTPLSDTDTVAITVTPVNDAPVAVDDTGNTDEKTALTIAAAGGLIQPNDTDVDVGNLLEVSEINGDATSVGTQITLPSGALLTVNSDGSYVYDPNEAFDSLATGESATDSFIYALSDGNGGTDTATVTLTITGVNDVPVAVDDLNGTDEDTPLVVTAANGLIASNDSDPDQSDQLVVSGVGLDAAGAVSGNANLGMAISGSNGGSFTIFADGSYTFDPGTDFQDLATGELRTTTITYQLSDGNGGTDTAVVTVTVSGLNDAPRIVDPANLPFPDPNNPPPATDPDNVVPIHVGEDSTLLASIDLKNYIIDLDGDPLTFSFAATGFTPPSWLILSNDGILSGTPDADASTRSNDALLPPGTYKVRIQATDGSQVVATNVTFEIANPDPVAQDDNLQTPETALVSGDVLADNGNGADADPDGDALVVATVNGSAASIGQMVRGSAGGEFTIYADGTFDFDPNGEFGFLATGDSSITTVDYVVSDGEGGYSQATLSVEVAGEDSAPVSAGPIPVQNGVDSEAISPIDASAAFGPGTFSYSASGLPDSLQLDPSTGIISGNLDSSASRSSPYQVFVTATDSNGVEASTTFPIIVTNPDPVASNNSAETPADTPIRLIPLSNDQDPDGDQISVLQVGVASNGTAILNPDNTITYQPDLGFTGIDQFTYMITDHEGGTATATVTISVGVDNIDAPEIQSQIDNQNETDGLAITTIDLSAAFSDPQGDILSFSASGMPEGITLDPATGLISGSLSNDASLASPYTIVVSATDPSGNTVAQTFIMSVSNPTPLAGDDAAETPLDTSVTLNPLANDTDPDSDGLTIVGTSDPANGSVAINSDGTITYTPDVGFIGTDPFIYTVDDGNGGRISATVTIYVGIDNASAPEVTGSVPSQIGATDGNALQPFDVSQFVTDPEGDPLQFDATGLPQGLVIDPATGVISGTLGNNASELGPNGDGIYQITIAVTDPDGNQTTFSFEIVVDNPAPIAQPNLTFTRPETPVTVSVLANDTDPDGDAISLASVTQPVGGTVVINPNGTLTFTPDAGTTGLVTFNYTIQDSAGDMAISTVTVNVTDAPVGPVLQPPVPLQTGMDGTTLDPVDVSNLFADPEGETPLFSGGVGNPAWIMVSPSGEITGTPTSDASITSNIGQPGEWEVEVVAEDSGGNSTSVFVRYSISNIPPDAVNDQFNTDQDTLVTGNVLADNGSGPDADIAPDADALIVSSVGGMPMNVGLPVDGSDGGTFTIAQNGDLSFDPGTDFRDLSEGELRTTTITYQISDGNGDFDTAEVTVTVSGKNDGPIIIDPSLLPFPDPNNPPLPADPDNIIPPVSVNDSESLTVINVGQYFLDPDGEMLTFILDTSTAPSWLSIDTNGIVTGTAPSDASIGGPNGDGEYAIKVIARDGSGLEVMTTLRISVENVAPVVNAPLGEQSAMVGGEVDFETSDALTDPDGDSLIYSATGLPGGLSIDPITGKISGTLSDTAVIDSDNGDGEYLITIMVDDGQGGMTSTQFAFVATELPFVGPVEPGINLPRSQGGDGDGEATEGQRSELLLGAIEALRNQIGSGLEGVLSLFNLAAGQSGDDVSGGKVTISDNGDFQVRALRINGYVFVEIGEVDEVSGWLLTDANHGWVQLGKNLFAKFEQVGVDEAELQLEQSETGAVARFRVDMTTTHTEIIDYSVPRDQASTDGLSEQVRKLSAADTDDLQLLLRS